MGRVDGGRGVPARRLEKMSSRKAGVVVARGGVV